MSTFLLLFKPCTLTPNFLLIRNKSSIHTFSSSSKSEATNLSLSVKRHENSERVIALFKSHGLTETHISKIVRVCPNILSADPQKTLVPKIEFLRSIGISNVDLPAIVSANPKLLRYSLENKLIPVYNLLKSVLVDDENVVKMLRLCSRTFRDVEKHFAPNINLLTEIGVPKSVISFMLLSFPSVANQSHSKFKRIVEEVIRMGFDPTKCTFVHAVDVLCRLNKTTLDVKREAYRKWGLSDDEIQMAFRAHPNSMSLSEEKITRGIDFFVNEMGWEAVKIARCPVVLFYDLENRIKPRCRVIRVLKSKGILKKDLALGTFLRPSENNFLEKFVTKYESKVPRLLDVYLGKTSGLEAGIGSEDLNEIETD